MFLRRKKSPVSRDEKKIDALLSRCVAEAIPSKDSLRALLLSGRRLTIKLGIDPTSPNIHLGRTVPLLKLREFQDLGHNVVFIAGDFTAVIGDTSDKDSERPMLAYKAIEKNMGTYRAQVGKILDLKHAKFKRNSTWLHTLTYREIGEQADVFSIADFIARDNIKRRLDAGKRVSLREVLYPLMQGYDSVAIKADVEIGGSDQRFNILAGRPLQEHYGQKPQHALLLSLITSGDGRKMSSSWGNTVNITDAPGEMFGKVMSVPDEFLESYFMHVTRIDEQKVRALMAGHPKEAKMGLAEEIVRMYHGDDAAAGAKKDFESTFSKGEIPADMPEIVLAGRPLPDALVLAKIVTSKSDYRRLEESGAITTLSEDESGSVMRIGKHRFVKIKK